LLAEEVFQDHFNFLIPLLGHLEQFIVVISEVLNERIEDLLGREELLLIQQVVRDTLVREGLGEDLLVLYEDVIKH